MTTDKWEQVETAGHAVTPSVQSISSSSSMASHHLGLGLAPAHPAAEDTGLQQPRVELEDSGLWSKFQSLTNEMIVTKNGRRMFPVIKVNFCTIDKIPRCMDSIQ